MTRGVAAGLLRGVAIVVLATGCAPAPVGAPTTPAPAQAVRVDPDARFWYSPAVPLGRPPADSLRNRNGSPRIADPAHYDRFWAEEVPLLREWSGDARLRINPAFVAALMAKESAFDPRATSGVPANGIAQLTNAADVDLLGITRESAAWRWAYDEVQRWPRSPLVHDALASKPRTDSLLASGALGPSTEYLFDPRTSTRAAVLWLRILAQVWTEDVWPGKYGTLAREKLAGGAPISESDLLALVTVSYNQGDRYVAALVQRYGRDWTQHLNDEAADYLDRISQYTGVFQRARAD